MATNHHETVELIVERFLKMRRQGRRVSIDDAVNAAEGLDAAQKLKARATAIGVISRLSRESAFQSLHDVGDGLLDELADDELPEIDGYDVIDVVGRGGMGMVYEAYQQSTGRRVAIKFMLERAAASEAARRRFEREVELIARFQHPNIISVIDSGVHNSRLYYVMEFVTGSPLDQAMEPGHQDVRGSLELLKRIAEAVEYAHQRGVLHRDLKPSNILLDDRGEPRLVDFGLAKAFDTRRDAQQRLSISQPGQLIGTLAYMPPEQARGQIERISVRTDVYALGAIGYEMVTGRLPCLVDDALDAVLVRITTQDAKAPSSVRKGVAKDVDAILLKALEKAPELRYAGAGEFAADIDRFLRDRPVEARRIGSVERSARWVRRNKRVTLVALTAAAIILAVSLVAIVRVTSAGRERDRSAQATTEATAWMDNALASLNLQDVREGKILVEDLLARQDLQLETNPPGDPLVEGILHQRFGENWIIFQRYGRAERHLRRALELTRQQLKAPHEDIARAMHHLARCYYHQANFAAAEELYRQALTMRREVLTAPDENLAMSLNHLAATLDIRGDPSAAEGLFREALEMLRELHGEESLQIAGQLNNLATCLRTQGRYAEAAALFAEALRLARAIPDEHQDRNVARSLHNLATCQLGLGELDGAEENFTEALALKRRMFGEEASKPTIALTLLSLARVLRAQGKLDDALDICNEAIAIQRELNPEKTPHHEEAAELALLGRIHMEMGNAGAAEPFLNEAVGIYEAVWPEGHARLDEAREWLGACRAQMKTSG